MAADPALALQDALIVRLRSAPGVTGLVGQRVYDEPPQAVTFPYVRLGNIEVRPAECSGRGVTFSIEAHSRPEAGRVEATRIAAEVVDALHQNEAAMVVSGFDLSWLEFVVQTVIRGTDGRTYQANIAFDAMLDAQ